MTTGTIPSPHTMPVLFLAHGAPILLDDAQWLGELAAWAKMLPKPKAILVISAHWEQRPTSIGATQTLPLYYDFYGFPEKYYQVKYPAPGATALAARVRELLGARSLAYTEAPERGLDHGAYIPLLAMYPTAEIPVLQISMPGMQPDALLALGRALSPLRTEGVLLIGSGFLTHNMRYAFKEGIPSWAHEFDAWAKESIARFDVDALSDFYSKAPGAALALPTWEHYAPLLVSVGAAAEQAHPVTFPIEGWWMNWAFTKRSVQFG